MHLDIKVYIMSELTRYNVACIYLKGAHNLLQLNCTCSNDLD